MQALLRNVSVRPDGPQSASVFGRDVAQVCERKVPLCDYRSSEHDYDIIQRCISVCCLNVTQQIILNLTDDFRNMTTPHSGNEKEEFHMPNFEKKKVNIFTN